MTREPAHNAVCDRCGGPLIVSGEVHLDAEPRSDGGWRAYVSAGGEWRVSPFQRYGDAFAGLRRREHVCVVPDVQLEIA